MRCGAAAHGGVRCANVGDREFDDFAAANNLKPCPQCKIQTLKFEGCNHITCQKCRHEWCWVCHGPYKVPGGHYKFGFFQCPGGQFGAFSNLSIIGTIIKRMFLGPLFFLLFPIIANIIVPLEFLCKGECHFLLRLIIVCVWLPVVFPYSILFGIACFKVFTIPYELIQVIRLFRLTLAQCRVFCCLRCCWI